MKAVFCLAALSEDGSIYIDSTIKSEIDLSQLRPDTRMIKVKVIEHTIRSLDANALYHVWIKQLTAFTGNDTKRQEAELKIEFGFPVLLQDETLGKELEWILKKYDFYSMSYDQQCNLVKWIPVTRLMSTKQLKDMMNNIKNWALNTHDVVLDNGKRE